MSQHILFVGADGGLTAVVGESLRGQGCGVSARPHCAGLKHVVEMERPALLVLDISAPHGDGLAVLRDLRMSGNDTPVILLSESSKAIDRVIGLELGADDFMSKPADPAELLARIRVLLRRRGALAPGAVGHHRQQYRRATEDGADGPHHCIPHFLQELFAVCLRVALKYVTIFGRLSSSKRQLLM